MSTHPASNSLYDSDLSSPESPRGAIEVMEPTPLNLNQSNSDNSGLLTGIPTASSENEISLNKDLSGVEELIADQKPSDSLRSIWSAPDVTSDVIERSKHPPVCIESNCVLKKAFVDDGRQVRYNYEDGVKPRTPFLVGPNKSNTARLYFDPESGTLVAGQEERNSWNQLGNFSLIGGIGNGAEADGSLVTGARNRIELDLKRPSKPQQPKNKICTKKGCPSDSSSSSDEYPVVPPSSAIVGGYDNILRAACGAPVATIGTSGVRYDQGDHTVIAALKVQPGENPLPRAKETFLTRNLYALGSAQIQGDLRARNGIFDNLSAKTISGGVTQSSAIVSNADITVTPESGLDIIYANPIQGPVTIRLGAPDNYIFPDSQSLIIKDATQEFGPNTSHNIYITVPTGNVRIEYYGSYTVPGVTGTYEGIVAGTGGTYILNTAGGSVTFRYMPPGLPGALPTWVIQNQLIGNQRIPPLTAGEFVPATDTTRSKILRRV